MGFSVLMDFYNNCHYLILEHFSSFPLISSSAATPHSPSPRPWQPLLFLSPCLCFCGRFHTNGIIQYVAFGDWLLHETRFKFHLCCSMCLYLFLFMVGWPFKENQHEGYKLCVSEDFSELHLFRGKPHGFEIIVIWPKPINFPLSLYALCLVLYLCISKTSVMSFN